MLDRSLEAIATSEPCVIDHCGVFGVDIHHRKQRSEGGDDRRANLCHICRRHHDWVHEHLDRAHELGLIIWGYEDDPKVIIKRVRIRPIKPKPKRPKMVDAEEALSTILE
jgi:hypothetical protein